MPWLDSFVRSYLVGLGEFDMENFDAQDSTFVWLFFILSTFVTQLIFMNLLIAIMGDTFDRVQEMKVQAATKEKISMIKDFIWMLDMEEEFKNSKYILIVEQQMTTSNGNTWEGKVGQLKSFMQQQSQSSQLQTTSLINDLSSKLGLMHHVVQT